MYCDRFDDIPPHVRAGMSAAEIKFYKATYDEPRLGFEYITAHRTVEMKLADVGTRDFFLGYWPSEALSRLAEFKARHYDDPPNPTSTMGDRTRVYYPRLFKSLDGRVAPLNEAADTHIWADVRERYEPLREHYYELLTAATLMARKGSKHSEDLHDLYRRAFEAVYPSLCELLVDLEAAGRR